MDDNDIVRGDGVAMDFDDVGAVLLGVFLTDSVGGELAGLSAGDEACAELEGENGAADKAARFDAYNFSDALVAIELRKIPADDVESAGILECGGEILEKNAFCGEVRDVANF